MTNYPTQFVPELRFLTSEDNLGDRADEAIDNLAAHGFVIAEGVHLSQVGRISEMAGEQHIVEYCPNDKRRFGSIEKVAAWLGKGGGRGMVSIFEVIDEDRPLSEDDIRSLNADDVSQVAYGWSGFGVNEHIPGADITTAYRVGQRGRELAYERRNGEEDRFKLGLPLGELVIATAVLRYGADPRQISLEAWESNKANGLYDTLGFGPTAVKQEDVRPTLEEVGTVVSGNEVFFDESAGNNMVRDTRLFRVLEDHPLLIAA